MSQEWSEDDNRDTAARGSDQGRRGAEDSWASEAPAGGQGSDRDVGDRAHRRDSESETATSSEQDRRRAEDTWAAGAENQKTDGQLTDGGGGPPPETPGGRELPRWKQALLAGEMAAAAFGWASGPTEHVEPPPMHIEASARSEPSRTVEAHDGESCDAGSAPEQARQHHEFVKAPDAIEPDHTHTPEGEDDHSFKKPSQARHDRWLGDKPRAQYHPPAVHDRPRGRADSRRRHY